LGLDLAPRVDCPLVMHFAENDLLIPPEMVARIKDAFGPDTAVYVYPWVAPELCRNLGDDD
jgi:carboxymethylenebutenolidase